MKHQTFEQAVAAKLIEKFDGDPAKYSDAMHIVAGEHSDLLEAYLTREHVAPGAEFVELTSQIHADKFGGDPQRYSEAMHVASEQRPDLAMAYKTMELFYAAGDEPPAPQGVTFSDKAKRLAREVMGAGLSDAERQLIAEAANYSHARTVNPRSANAGPLLRKAFGLGDKVVGSERIGDAGFGTPNPTHGG